MPSRCNTTGKRATIKDVARLSGVSVTTVSNVLNRRWQAMSEMTLARVQEAIRSLDYRPNRTARSLVTGHAATIGLILIEIDTPLFLQALSAIDPLARESGYNILLCSARDLDDERHALSLLREKGVDGIIFVSTSTYSRDEHLVGLQQSGPPVVLVNRATLHAGLDQVNWDNATGAASAVRHLARLGHRCIALLCGPVDRRSSEERLTGYKDALVQSGLAFRPDYVQLCDYASSREAWQQATLALLALAPRPSAIIAADDIVAAVAMKTVQRAGCRVPEDIAVIGFDDQPFCTYLSPALTTVRLPVAEAGKRAITMLLDRIAGRRTAADHLMLPCPLVVRESCGAERVAGT